MKLMKQVEIPSKVVTVVDKTVCDLCKMEIPNEGRFVVDEVTVQYKTGNSYPEGGSGETLSVDLCPRCFEERLIPWLESQGAKPETIEWDW